MPRGFPVVENTWNISNDFSCYIIYYGINEKIRNQLKICDCFISFVLIGMFQLTLQLTIYCSLWCTFEYWAARICVILCWFYLFFSVLFHFILELNRVSFKKSMTSRNSKNTLKPSPMYWLCLPRTVSSYYWRYCR